MIWLVLLLLAWAQGGHRQPGGAGPLALASMAALIDIALLGNIGRWWMTPRWPDRAPASRLGRLIDPLRWPLPVATIAVLVGNMLLTLADRMLPLDWLSLGLCVGGLGLLGVALTHMPSTTRPALPDA